MDYAQGCALFENEATPQEDSAALLAHAAQLAANADLIVACVGLDATMEGEEGDAFNAFAGGDKLDLELRDSEDCSKPTNPSVSRDCRSVLRYRSEMTGRTPTPTRWW